MSVRAVLAYRRARLYERVGSTAGVRKASDEAAEEATSPHQMTLTGQSRDRELTATSPAHPGSRDV